jgi:hemoglobin
VNTVAPHVVHRPAPGLEAGVDEAMIRRVVHAFYDLIRADATLGPIFASVIEDWDPHLEKMCDFWSSMLLMTKRYDGRPVPAHVRIEGLGAPHFERWLQLFRATARAQCPEPAAELFIDRAERVARSLQMAIDFHNGAPPPFGAPIRAG